MRNYAKVDISEQRLEDLIQQNPQWIEKGFLYLTRQESAAGGRLDLLMVDGDRSLVVAELKICADDGMLLQALEYYDYILTRLDSYVRRYSSYGIRPGRRVRLLLVAPAFSDTLLNACKWVGLNIPISLFTFACIQFDEEKDVYPIFVEQRIPASYNTTPIPDIEEHLEYITDSSLRSKTASLVEQIRNWRTGKISLVPAQDRILVLLDGRMFAQLVPTHKHCGIVTRGADGQWTGFQFKGNEDLTAPVSAIREALERAEQAMTRTTAAAGN